MIETLADMEQEETTVYFLYPTVTPVPSTGSPLGWIAAPVILFILLFALLAALFTCVLLHKINRKRVRVRPQTDTNIGTQLEFCANRDLLQPVTNKEVQNTFLKEPLTQEVVTEFTFDKVEDISMTYPLASQEDSDILVTRLSPPMQGTCTSSYGNAVHHPISADDSDLYSYTRLWSPT